MLDIKLAALQSQANLQLLHNTSQAAQYTGFIIMAGTLTILIGTIIDPKKYQTKIIITIGYAILIAAIIISFWTSGAIHAALTNTAFTIK